MKEPIFYIVDDYYDILKLMPLLMRSKQVDGSRSRIIMGLDNDLVTCGLITIR